MPRLGEKPVVSGADARRVGDLLLALGITSVGPLHMLTVPGVPYSKSRPRFGGRGRAFSKPEDVTAEHRTAIYMRATVRQPFTGNVALACLFYRPTLGRVDVDNLVKHVCDAGNGVIYVDDQQCTGVSAVVELDRDNPRTILAVAPHQSSMVRDLSKPKPPPKGAFL